MFNELSGPTSHDVPWHSIYSDCAQKYPARIGEMRKTIAWHGVGHAMIQATAGIGTMALRMPSFSDTPHVRVIVPIATQFPCGAVSAPYFPNAEMLCASLCHKLAGYCFEFSFNEGELRGIAGLHDLDKAMEDADALGGLLGKDPFLLIASAIFTIERALAANLDACDAMVEQLLSVGHISFTEFASYTNPMSQHDLSTQVLENLHNVDDKQTIYVERMLS